MQAVVWSAIALVRRIVDGHALPFGFPSRRYLRSDRRPVLAVDGLSSRIDALGASFDARLQSLNATMDARFDRVDDRLISLEQRLDAHIGRHAG